MAEQEQEEKAGEKNTATVEKAGVKNTITIEDAGPCRKKVIVEIPKETITKVLDEQYETYRKEAIIPGFRKGRAPRRLLEKRLGKDANETVKVKLLASASEEAIKESKLDILREPNIDPEKITLPADGPMNFDFEVEVRPEFELPALEGIPVEKTKMAVTEANIDKEIEAMLKYAGAWTPKEKGAVEAGDQVVADVMLNIEGQEQKLDNIEIQARPSGLVGEIPVEKLDELLVGAKAGDTKKTEVTVSKTYFKEDLRGKKVDMRLTVKDVKWLKPTELNQDFVTRYGMKDEAELRDKIRKQMQGRLEQQGKSEMAEQIYKYLFDNTKFDLPVDVAADQAVALLRRQYINLMMQGVQREMIDEHIEQLKVSSEQQAQQQLKVFFIMDKISEKLKIKTTDEEINGHIAQLAQQRHVRPERMKEDMQRDGSLEQFKQQVREQKCIDKLLETAKITEVEPKPEEHKPKAAKETKAEKPKRPSAPKGSAGTGKKAAVKTAEKPPKKTAEKVPAKEKAAKKKPTRKKKT
jgi:trigger factor